MENDIFKRIKRKILTYFIVIGIIVIAFVITVSVLYSMNPQKLEENMNNIAQQLQDYLDNLNGKKVVPDKLEFPEEEKLTEAQRYYYYQQLSDTAKKIYLTIENNIDKLKNGEDNIPLPSSLNEDAKSNEMGKDYITKEFQAAWDAFVTDKSEYFFLDSSKVCLVTKMTTRGSNKNYEFFIGKGENDNYFIDSFKNKEEVELAIKSVENGVSKPLESNKIIFPVWSKIIKKGSPVQF